MPLAFLAPVFLAGLAALAIPVLIHLANRPRKEPVRFPSLMFLEKVEYRASSRRRIRNLVLFALRCLALILIAGAFARPFLDRPDAPPVAIDGGREVVVLFDRSASMAIDDRMDRARAEVGEIAAGLRRGDRATLVAFDHGAAAANRATGDPATLRAAADSLRPGDGGTRLGPALRLAESILAGSPLPRRELVVISDFQRRAWDAESAVAAPEGTAVRLVRVGQSRPNAAVADAAATRERFSGRERARVTATVSARGGPFEGPVALELDGRVVQEARLAVAAGEVGRVTFDPVTLPDRPVRATVRIPGDALTTDDALHLTLRGDRPLRVVIGQDPGADRRTSLYLARALQAGPDHDVAVLPVAALTTTALAGVDVVVLNDAEPAGDAGARRIREFAESGGGVIVVLGDRSRGRGVESLGLGRLQGTRDRTADGGASLARVDAQHPIFEPFRGAAAGQLSRARFFRYRVLDPEPGATVLARYDDGAAAMVVRDLGQGRVVGLTAPLDGRWGDLVLQPSFLPLTHRLARHASGRTAVPAWRTVGEVLDVGPLLAAAPDPASDPGSGPVVRTPSGGRIPLTPERTVISLEERGFYEVRDPRTGAPPAAVAVNADPAESELEPMDTDVVEAALMAGGAPPILSSGAPVDRERTQSLWWWVLAAAFVVLAFETVVGNVVSRRYA
ncbi:MAG TPA: BatA domain-containing protein [Longimicrobiales bacterium]|nr:BatA domain-containing protein [Longimicrobiales bacterium]